MKILARLSLFVFFLGTLSAQDRLLAYAMGVNYDSAFHENNFFTEFKRDTLQFIYQKNHFQIIGTKKIRPDTSIFGETSSFNLKADTVLETSISPSYKSKFKILRHPIFDSIYIFYLTPGEDGFIWEEDSLNENYEITRKDSLEIEFVECFDLSTENYFQRLDSILEAGKKQGWTPYYIFTSFYGETIEHTDHFELKPKDLSLDNVDFIETSIIFEKNGFQFYYPIIFE